MSSVYAPGVVAQMALQVALREHTPTEPHRKPSERLWQSEPFCAHWTSSIQGIDSMLVDIHNESGFYGVTVIASEGKVGKSTLALASALQAAATLDWQVRFFNAELTEREFEDRKQRYLAAHPTCGDADQMFRAYHTGRGVSAGELTLLCHEEPSPEPMLVVLDSINTMASLSKGHYLNALQQISLWAMMASRYSDGAVSFLIVAETNKAGGIKGEQLQFWADCIVRLREPKERGWVDIDITHSRRTPAGPVGRFLRHTPSASFRQHGDHLRVVGGNEWD